MGSHHQYQQTMQGAVIVWVLISVGWASAKKRSVLEVLEDAWLNPVDGPLECYKAKEGEHHMFKCGETKCIPADRTCNTKVDCPDGRDENCCKDPDYVSCLDGTCLNRVHLCDGVNHCGLEGGQLPFDEMCQDYMICPGEYCPHDFCPYHFKPLFNTSDGILCMKEPSSVREEKGLGFLCGLGLSMFCPTNTTTTTTTTTTTSTTASGGAGSTGTGTTSGGGTTTTTTTSTTTTFTTSTTTTTTTTTVNKRRRRQAFIHDQMHQH